MNAVVKRDMFVVATQEIKVGDEIFICCGWDENQMHSSSSEDDNSIDNGDKKPATKRTGDSNSNCLESNDSAESKESKKSEESKDCRDNEEEHEEEEDD